MFPEGELLMFQTCCSSV